MYRTLVMGCLAALAVHGLAGHAHADPLAPVPVTNHIAGDAHHEGTGACDGLQGVAWVGAAEGVPGSWNMSEATATGRSGSGDRPPAIARPPRFLLHAALLI